MKDLIYGVFTFRNPKPKEEILYTNLPLCLDNLSYLKNKILEKLINSGIDIKENEELEKFLLEVSNLENILKKILSIINLKL